MDALSRPPWFSALTVWHIGDSWGGQCGFMSDRKVFIGAGFPPGRFEGKLAEGMEWTADRSDGYWWHEQFLGGWKRLPSVDGRECGDSIKRSSLSPMEVCRRWLKGNWQMEIYHIQDENRELIATLGDVFFGDFDSDGQFVFARYNGIGYRALLSNIGLSIHEVCDLPAMRPQAMAAPPGVTVW